MCCLLSHSFPYDLSPFLCCKCFFTVLNLQAICYIKSKLVINVRSQVSYAPDLYRLFDFRELGLCRITIFSDVACGKHNFIVRI